MSAVYYYGLSYVSLYAMITPAGTYVPGLGCRNGSDISFWSPSCSSVGSESPISTSWGSSRASEGFKGPLARGSDTSLVGELAAVDGSEVYKEHKQKHERLKQVEMLPSVSHTYICTVLKPTHSDTDVKTHKG